MCAPRAPTATPPTTPAHLGRGSSLFPGNYRSAEFRGDTGECRKELSRRGQPVRSGAWSSGLGDSAAALPSESNRDTLTWVGKRPHRM